MVSLLSRAPDIFMRKLTDYISVRMGTDVAPAEQAKVVTLLAATGVLPMMLLHLGDLQGAACRDEEWGFRIMDPSGRLKALHEKMRKLEEIERMNRQRADAASNGRAGWGRGTGYSSG